MDQRVVEEKLESMRKCIKRIEDKRPDDVSTLKNDPDMQDIISVNLERAVKLCVDIGTHFIAESEKNAPLTMSETFDVLLESEIITEETATSMKNVVRFRNMSLHNYQKIDWEIVFSICHKNVENFKVFARQISKLLD